MVSRGEHLGSQVVRRSHVRSNQLGAEPMKSRKREELELQPLFL